MDSSIVNTSDPLSLWENHSDDDVQSVIRAVYKQVLGNPYVMESERLTSAESKLADGQFSVRDFVRAVGKSDFYRRRYFEACAPYRFVELNFMHFLGRPPESQVELSEHIVRCVSEGYEVEIDSYLSSDEYKDAFGENTVPYRRVQTQAGQSQVTFNRMFALDRGPAQISGAVKASQLVYDVATNSSNTIAKPAVNLAGTGEANKKMFKIQVQGAKFNRAQRVSNTTYTVPGDSLTRQIQLIQRASGKIVSITEVV